jgi:hypothetical protein
MILKLQASEGTEMAAQFAAMIDREEKPTETQRARRPLSLGLHFRRIAVVFLSVACRTWIPFLLLGALNRLFPVFASVFFCYAGNKRYAGHYSYKSCRNFLIWFPSTIGIFRQGKKWGLICASPVTEAEFTDPKNSVHLNRLLRRLQRIKAILGAYKLSNAGILPTVINRKGPDFSDLQPDHTPEVVRKAVLQLRDNLFHGQPHKVVLLGGAGRIGRGVQDSLRTCGIDSHVIDPTFPATINLRTLTSQNVLLVDVSRYGVIQRYLEEIPEGTVVLNEVFPEPNNKVLAELRRKNITAYHIAGVPAEVYPSLPLGYAQALPCCAIHSGEIGEPILTRIA